MSPRGPCSKKPPRKTSPLALESLGALAQSGRGGAQDTRAAKSYYERAAALGDEDAKAALKRLDCPYVLKNKRGEVWSNLCF